MGNTDIQCLERFISENAELEELESIVNEFNIFTSLKIQFVEIRHSNFLSWLLDPSETHGLGDYFLKIFLKRLIDHAKSYDFSEISLVDIDFWDLDNVEVRREWKNIDLLIKDDENRFICVLENKIKSKEHGDQLERYFKTVTKELKNFKYIFVYLSVDGDLPENDENNNWIPYNYKQVSDSIEYLLKSKKSVLSDEIVIFVSHYLEMLRRYIMKESKVQELCQRIYKKHQRAIDLIIEHKPDRMEEISQMLQEVIKAHDQLIPDISSKTYIRFTARNLDFIPKLGSGWTRTKRILLFEFQNYDSGISLSLYIGPGDTNIRQQIFNIASANKSLFNATKEKLNNKWTSIYNLKVIDSNEYDNLEDEELKANLTKKFSEFIDKDLPRIENELLKLKADLV